MLRILTRHRIFVPKHNSLDVHHSKSIINNNNNNSQNEDVGDNNDNDDNHDHGYY